MEKEIEGNELMLAHLYGLTKENWKKEANAENKSLHMLVRRAVINLYNRRNNKRYKERELWIKSLDENKDANIEMQTVSA